MFRKFPAPVLSTRSTQSIKFQHQLITTYKQSLIASNLLNTVFIKLFTYTFQLTIVYLNPPRISYTETCFIVVKLCALLPLPLDTRRRPLSRKMSENRAAGKEYTLSISFSSAALSSSSQTSLCWRRLLWSFGSSVLLLTASFLYTVVPIASLSLIYCLLTFAERLSFTGFKWFHAMRWWGLKIVLYQD